MSIVCHVEYVFSMKLPRPSDKRINYFLLACIVVVNVYTIVLPFLPRLTYAKKLKDAQATAGLPYQTKQDTSSTANISRKSIPNDERLVIPGIALDEHIYTGTDPYLVHKGVWARPSTSTPTSGGNTVLVGHRFTYSGPSVFYNLDKMQTGDKISVYWKKIEYIYTVIQTKVVPATEISVEAPTANAQLTLYTCTPLWSAKDRLVVIAVLDTGASE